MTHDTGNPSPGRCSSLSLGILGMTIALAPVARAEHIAVPAGLGVDLVLQHHVTAGYSAPDSAVFFRIADDVRIADRLVFRRGTLARGRVTVAENRGMVGRSGRLSMEVRTLPAVDGTVVPVDVDWQQKGRSRAGATVGWTIFWGPAGLITKGVNPYLLRGAVVHANVITEAVVDPAESAATPAPESVTPTTSPAPEAVAIAHFATHQFQGSRDKVRTIDIERNDDLETVTFKLAPDSLAYAPAEIIGTLRLTAVDGAPVPEPVPAARTGKDGVTFGSWSIVQFCNDGVTNLHFEGRRTDGGVFAIDYPLQVKIKRKRQPEARHSGPGPQERT